MKLTYAATPGVDVPNVNRSLKHLAEALEQLQQSLSTLKLYDRMYKGRPLPADVYVTPEARADAAPWLKAFRYPLLHLVVDQTVRDSPVEAITTPTDASTKAIEAVYTRLKANLVLWPVAIHYAEQYGKSYIHGWRDPMTGRFGAWVETPFTMQAIKVNGMVIALARIWEDQGLRRNKSNGRLRRINLEYGKRIEKWASDNGREWYPYVEDYKLQPDAVIPEPDEPIENPGDVFDLDENGRVQSLWPLPNDLGVVPGVELATSPVDPVSGMEHGIPIYAAMIKSWAQAVQSTELLGSPTYLAAVASGQMSTVGGPRPTMPQNLPRPGAPAGQAQPGSVQRDSGATSIPITVGSIIKGTLDNLHRLGGESPEPILEIVNAALLGVARVTSTAIVDIDPAHDEVSGVSRREARRNYTDKLTFRHAYWGAAIADFTLVVAIAEGIPLTAEDIVTVQFKNPDKLDDTELYGTPVVKGMQDAGIPIEDTLEMQGFEPSKVAAWKTTREAAAQKAFEMAQQSKAPAEPSADPSTDATPAQAAAQDQQRAKGKAVRQATGRPVAAAA